MSLRLTNDEWKTFKTFLDDTKDLAEFEAIQIMFFHLFTENFFRFTIKNETFALDFDSNENELDESDKSHRDTNFWNQIRDEVDLD
jgi:hypothetical protein